MSNSSSSENPSTGVTAYSKIGETALYGVTWALCGVAAVFIVVRLVIRLRFSRRLFVDDYFCLLALSILIGNAIVIQLMGPPMYKILAVSFKQVTPGPSFMERSSFYLKCQFASTVLFWSCLWAVKGSFLAFFYRLTNQVKWPRVLWWVVVTITVLSYIGSIITYPVSCTSFTLGECTTPLNIKRSLISLRYSTAVDIITDLLIMAIPMWLVLGLKMSLSQKLGLCAVLGLGVIIIIFSVVRIIVTNTIGSQPEITWLALWSSIESSVAVIVACLASFKVLLSARKDTSYPGGYNGPSGGGYQKNANSGRQESGKRMSNRFSSRYGTNKSSTTRVGHRELSSESYEDSEMDDLGKSHARATFTVTGGRDGRGRRFADKDRDEDAESQENIIDDGIRVQTTWNVQEDQHLPSHHGT